ncbi:MAG: phosphoadenosine phosphosulfate reductase family protein [Ardenticatenales bacterium]|nr:phosphoadenosine phosphosulfate reductase family protein [Ardenticatenales bacterium]
MDETAAAPQSVRHILSLSGGKDSTALAIYMKDRIPEMEYVFCDTGEELPETYEYLDKLEVYLGKPIERLKPDNSFEELLKVRRGFLPSPQVRWCTELLKIKPFEKYIGDDLCYSYVGIRADEPHRKGYISTKPNIIARYPFIDDGLIKDDIFQILDESGLGLPEYYKWRSRSGCYFCFFQQRIEWVGLLENHGDLYEKAIKFEKEDEATGERYTWAARESLEELKNPERIEQIREEFAKRQSRGAKLQANQTLTQIFSDEELSGDTSCLICHL